MSEPTKSAVEIIESVGELVRKVWANKDNPEMLSKIGNDLAVLNWALGEWLSVFSAEEIAGKTELDLKRAELTTKYVNQDMAVNKAELKVTTETIEQRKAYNQIVNNVGKVKICRKDTDKIIDMVRTRISLIKGEIK